MCKKHGSFKLYTCNFLKGHGCPKCGRKNTSKIEREIADLIPNSELSNRTLINPLEIDIVSHEYKIGIEYNGLMWHSIGKHKSVKFNNYKNEDILRNKHLLKTEQMETLGYQLFHIFENEWLEPRTQNIWKSIIHSKTHQLMPIKINSGNYSIKELNQSECNIFLHNNYLTGSDNSTIRLGIFYKNELVQVMTFNRINDLPQFELLSICSKIGDYNIDEIFFSSKLLNYFEEKYNPDTIISYVDRRWSTGSLHQELGFTNLCCTNTDYFYFKINENILYSRTEVEKSNSSDNMNNMNDLYNYRKIYDSGNKVFIKNYK